VGDGASAGTPAGRPPARIGWLSTGRDDAARRLLEEVVRRAARDDLPLEVACVFCDREPGESEPSDRFLDTAQRLGLDVATISSARSWRRWQERLGTRPAGTTTDAATLPAVDSEASREVGREQFHEELMWELKSRAVDVLVLAGYMLILSPQTCLRYPALNLHPALPGGPTGTWQEVIWELLRTRADETGAMMHLATPVLDRGPAVALFRFSIRGGDWDALWDSYLEKEERLGLEGVRDAQGEAEPLFAEIRRRGEEREIPLLYQTVAQFVRGDLCIDAGAVCARDPGTGRRLDLPVDLTTQVEAELRTGESRE
jgi:phosphoribosylglycinamide formyltransferase-1